MIEKVMLVALLVLQTVVTTGQTNKERYEIFGVCFNTEAGEYAARIVNGGIWFLSESKAADGKVILDELANKPFTDVFVKDSCNRIDAKLRSSVDGEWLPISSQYYDGPVASALGGKVLFFTNNSDPALNGKMGLFGLKQVTDTTWTYLEGITFNSDQYSVVHPYFDGTNSTLYFSSDMDTIGGRDFDIYRVSFTGEFIGTPTAVSEVNTASNEWFPMISNGRLNFTSDREGGVGGMDVYYLDNGQVNHYPAPVNSTGDDYDVFYLESNTAFISSNRSEGFNDQIYFLIDYGVPSESIVAENALTAAMNAKLEALGGVVSDTTLGLSNSIIGSMATQSYSTTAQEAKEISAQEVQAQKLLSLQAEQLKRDVARSLITADDVDYIQASNTQQEVARLADRLVASSSDPIVTQRIMDSIRGVLTIAGMSTEQIAQLEKGISSSVDQLDQLTARKEEMSRQMENAAALVINEVKRTNPDKLAALAMLTKNFPDAENQSVDLVKLFGEEAVKEYAKSFVSKPILFAFDSDDLRSEYHNQLNDFALFVDQFPMFKLFVDGHTDITGNRSYNMKLAGRRAKSVKRYLIKQDVPKTVFVLEAYGPNRPVQSNETKQGREANRRVEIRLVPAEK
jgi:outer membrane protein OmpA-like peptidoglycan-associated protein